MKKIKITTILIYLLHLVSALIIVFAIWYFSDRFNKAQKLKNISDRLSIILRADDVSIQCPCIDILNSGINPNINWAVFKISNPKRLNEENWDKKKYDLLAHELAHLLSDFDCTDYAVFIFDGDSAVVSTAGTDKGRWYDNDEERLDAIESYIVSIENDVIK